MRIMKSIARYDDGTSTTRDHMRAIRKRRFMARKKRRTMRENMRAKFWRFAFS